MYIITSGLSELINVNMSFFINENVLSARKILAING